MFQPFGRRVEWTSTGKFKTLYLAKSTGQGFDAFLPFRELATSAYLPTATCLGGQFTPRNSTDSIHSVHYFESFMGFLDDFNAVYANSREPSLLDVQKIVFEHFEDLRKSSRDSSSEPFVDTQLTPVKRELCSCHLDPGDDITLLDLLRYRDLLATVAVGRSVSCEGDLQRRNKSHQTSELKVLHGRVTKAQLNIQEELLKCVQCTHGSLSPQSESVCFELLLRRFEGYLNCSGASEYKFLEAVTVGRNVGVGSVVFRCVQMFANYKLLIPGAGKNCLSLSNQMNIMNFQTFQDTPLPDCVHRQPGGRKKSLVLVPELVLMLLFCQVPLDAIYIPFAVSEFVGDHKKRFKELKFCHPLWFEPPDPRTRARLFYDMVAQFYFCNEQSDSPVETTGISSHCKRIRTNAVVEHRSEPNIGPTSSPSAPSKSTRVRTRSVGSAQALDASKVKLTQHHSDQSPTPQPPNSTEKGTNSKSRHQNSSHPTSESLVRRSSRLASTKFAKLPKNSNNHRPDEPVNSDEADEAEFGDLSIDISTNPEEKDRPNDASDLTSLRKSVLTTCAVVSRTAVRTRSGSLEANGTSGPASPITDDPASPSESTEADLDAVEFNRTTWPVAAPLEIPLEPVQRCSSPLPQTSVSRNASPERDISRDQVDQHTRTPGPVSVATIELNGTPVLVQFTNTVWAVGESCLACSNRTNAETGMCPLWPSCDSLKSRWAKNESKLGNFQPVYLQIKPEYLGDWGCEVLSPFELAQAWLGSVLRDKADIVRVRVRVDSGELVWLEYQSLNELLSAHPDLKPEMNAGVLSALFDKLLSLSPGSYLLSHDNTASYAVYEAISEQERHNSRPNTSSPNRSEVVLLQNAFDRFKRLASAVVSLASVFESQSTDSAEVENEAVNPLWFTVPRARLDLDLPAGLDISGQNQSGRVLRLPALPLNRLHSSRSEEHLPHSNSSAKRKVQNRTKRSKLNKPTSFLSHSQKSTPVSKSAAKRHLRRRAKQSTQ